jgi:hypothetical protein
MTRLAQGSSLLSKSSWLRLGLHWSKDVGGNHHNSIPRPRNSLATTNRLIQSEPPVANSGNHRPRQFPFDGRTLSRSARRRSRQHSQGSASHRKANGRPKGQRPKGTPIQGAKGDTHRWNQRGHPQMGKTGWTSFGSHVVAWAHRRMANPRIQDPQLSPPTTDRPSTADRR